jgi:hypothetical protein
MLTRLKRLIRPAPKPVLGPTPCGGPADSRHTLLIVCRTGFDINVPNANSTYRLGLARGFAQIGIGYRLVSVFELEQGLRETRQPIVLLSASDYEDLNAQARKLLRNHPHFIWAFPWFDRLEEVYARYKLPDPRLSASVTRRILESGASFVYAPVPPSCLVYYEFWQKHGQRVASVLQACDTERYGRQPEDTRYRDVRMCFVGGYWAYKNIQFEKYLKPYEDALTIYGYAKWPYRGYKGMLPDDAEKVLYQNARLCPALSEPHAEVMGDIVERVYKILGSGGVAITDVVPFYREVFAADELLVPTSVSEYHELVRQALEDDDFNQRLRERGFRAIMERHTYAHRARQIMDLLGLPHGPAPMTAVTH